MKFLDKNNHPLNKGDLISFDGGNPELLYECDMGYNMGVGLGVNASRHYVGSELYPLTDFPCEMTAEGKIRMLTGEKFLIAVIQGQEIKTIVRWGKNGRKYVWENPTQEVVNKLIKRYGGDQICDGTLWLQW